MKIYFLENLILLLELKVEEISFQKYFYSMKNF